MKREDIVRFFGKGLCLALIIVLAIIQSGLVNSAFGKQLFFGLSTQDLENQYWIEQADEFIEGRASTLDCSQGKATAHVPTMPGNDHPATIVSMPQYNMATRLMINFKTNTLKSPDDLAWCHSGQTRHHAGSRVTLGRPMN